MDVGQADRPAHAEVATTTGPLRSSLREGLTRLRDRTKTLSFRKQPPISEEPSLVAQMEEEYHRAVSDRAIDRRLLKTYPHPAGPPVRLDMTRRLQQLEEEDNNSGSGSVTHHSNELYGPPGPRPLLVLARGLWERNRIRTTTEQVVLVQPQLLMLWKRAGWKGVAEPGKGAGPPWPRSSVSWPTQEGRAGEFMFVAETVTHPLITLSSVVAPFNRLLLVLGCLNLSGEQSLPHLWLTSLRTLASAVTLLK